MARLVVLIFCVFSITTGEFVVAGILPEVAGDLGVTVGTAGLLVTAYAIGMIVGGPVLTALSAAVDRQRLMLVLLTVAVAGNLASALAPTFTVLLAARVLTALVTSTFFAQAIVVAVRSGPAERAASTVAKLAFGMNLAMILGAPIGTGIGSQWGWRATFTAIAAACLLGLLLVSQIIPKTQTAQPRTSAVAELNVLRQRPVLIALTITAVGNVGVLMVFSYLAPLMTNVAGHTDNRLPALLLAYGLGATVGNLAGGALFDHHPRSAQPTMLATLAAALIACWFIATTPLPATIAVIVIGALGFAIIPGMQARVMAAATDAPTLAMAVNASGYQIAAAAAGIGGGLLVDSNAGARPIYLAAATTTLCGLTISMAATRNARHAVQIEPDR